MDSTRDILTRILLPLTLLMSTQTMAVPTEFKAVYDADYRGVPIGATGIRKLTRLKDGSYLLESSAKNFLASVKEQSLFTLHPDGSLRPQEYQYHRSGLGKNRDAVLTFNWDENQVLNNVQNKPWKMDIPDGTLDKLVYQFKMRQDLERAYENDQPWPELTYEVADGGRMKTYRFEVLGEDRTRTPLGTFDTIKARRIREPDDERTTIFWLAPAYEFMLVRFRQFEEKDGGFELLIEELEINGKPVSPDS